MAIGRRDVSGGITLRTRVFEAEREAEKYRKWLSDMFAKNK